MNIEFKHNGFRFFVKFCEKYGIPWAVGKYPAGTAQKQIDELADSLARMVEDAIAAIPDSGAVQLIENSAVGQLPQERLIKVCNREMSKCLNSQTLATEINGAGSYAAAETHREREQLNGTADRKIIEDTNNQFLLWVTELNFVGAAQPLFEFYEESDACQEWVDVFNEARNFLDIPVKFAHEQLQIPMPQKGEAVVLRSLIQPLKGEAVVPRSHRQPRKQADFAQQPSKYLEQWVEIFRVDVSASTGKVPQFTAKELEEVIANFNPQTPPPYVIGQPKDTDPAYGWVGALKCDGLSLWAKGTKIEPQFDNIIKEGRYSKKAIRVMPTANGWKLIHVSFLGAVPPVLPGLKSNREFARPEIINCHDYIF